MEQTKVKLSKYLKRRHAEIMIAEERPVTIRELAQRCGIPENNLGRWMEGIGLPSPQYIPDLADVFGDLIYEIMGYPKPIPNDPEFREFMELWFSAREDPNDYDILRKALLQARAQLHNKTVRNRQVTFGT